MHSEVCQSPKLHADGKTWTDQVDAQADLKLRYCVRCNRHIVGFPTVRLNVVFDFLNKK